MRIRAAFLVGVAAAALAQTDADPWKKSELLEPKEVAARLARKPVVFHVGFGTLYRSKHIPGSIYVGPDNKPEGIQALRQAAAKLPRDREVILYCGCCPWDKCPNMRPAFRTLKEMGFTRVYAMYVPTNFAKDWIEKGWAVEGATAR